MMAIYQIYIQGKNINSFYNEMNHTTFRKLFFDTIYSVINLIHKEPDDVISSKHDKKSEYQGKNTLEHIQKKQQPDDVISSKNNQVFENQGKDAQKESFNNQSLDKYNPSDENEKDLPDDATSGKRNQKTSQGKDDLTSSTTNPSTEKNVHKDTEDKQGSNDKSIMKEDSNKQKTIETQF